MCSTAGSADCTSPIRSAWWNEIVVPYAPPLVVIYAGGNDIDAGKTPAVVAADFQAFTARVWSHLPRTQIAFV